MVTWAPTMQDKYMTPACTTDASINGSTTDTCTNASTTARQMPMWMPATARRTPVQMPTQQQDRCPCKCLHNSKTDTCVNTSMMDTHTNTSKMHAHVNASMMDTHWIGENRHQHQHHNECQDGCHYRAHTTWMPATSKWEAINTKTRPGTFCAQHNFFIPMANIVHSFECVDIGLFFCIVYFTVDTYRGARWLVVENAHICAF